MAVSRRRRRNVDPVIVTTQASSMAYNLAVARELGKLQKKNVRKNPGFAKHLGELRKNLYRKNVGWGDIVGSVIGTTVGGAITKGTRKNPTLLIASNPQAKRKAAHKRRPNTGTTRKPRGFDENDPEFRAALKKYREFFEGEEPIEIVKVNVKSPMPKYLIALGKAPEVTYAPEDHTPKRGVPFKHEFGDEGGEPPYLVTDKTGKFLGYVGGTFKVRDWIID